MRFLPWFEVKRVAPARVVRAVVQLNGQTCIDIDSRLALLMIDCRFGKPVVEDYLLQGQRVRLILEEEGHG